MINRRELIKPVGQEEHQRLKDAVVDAAKVDREAETRKEGDVGIDGMIAARRAFRAAVTALIEFESNKVS